MQRMVPVVLLALVFAGLGAIAAPAARAQDEAAKREARRRLKAGDRALLRGDRYASRPGREDRATAQYERALAAYRAAYEAYPQPQIYFAIGNAEEKLGRYIDAHRHYKRLLEEASSASEELRAAVDERIQVALENLSVIYVKIQPEGARVFVDEEEIGVSPLVEPLILEPGPHRISVRKDGYTPNALEIETKRGDKLEESIELVEIPEVEELEAAPPPRQALGPPPGRGILLASLITTGLLAAGTTTTGIFALTEHGTFTDEAKSLGERQDAGDTGETFALTTDILLGATVLAAGWTTYYYYGIYRPRTKAWIEDATGEAEAEAEAEATWVRPYAGPTGAGLAVGGEF